MVRLPISSLIMDYDINWRLIESIFEFISENGIFSCVLSGR